MLNQHHDEDIEESKEEHKNEGQDFFEALREVIEESERRRALIGLLLLLESLRNHNPLDKESWRKLKKYHITNENLPSLDCPICMCAFEEGEYAKELPCEHIFHKQCIKTWFEEHSTCPICRQDATLRCEENPH